jgi:hypothetical protein
MVILALHKHLIRKLGSLEPRFWLVALQQGDQELLIGFWILGAKNRRRAAQAVDSSFCSCIVSTISSVPFHVARELWGKTPWEGTTYFFAGLLILRVQASNSLATQMRAAVLKRNSAPRRALR